MIAKTSLRCVLLICIAAGLLPGSGAAADWAQFRGPGGNGIAPDAQLPATWADGKNVIWRTALPGPGSSSPIIVGDRVYVTCYSGYGLDSRNPGNMQDLRLHVVCVRRGDGGLVGDVRIEPKLPETERVRDHGYAAHTPCSDGQNLYVFFGKTGLVKLDSRGRKLWQADTGSGKHSWGSGTSPVLHGNLVIVNASIESGSLIAFDTESGREVWRAGGMQQSWNTPHLVTLAGGKRELVVSVKGRLLAFDPASGKPLWNCEGIPDYVCPSVVSHRGVVYAIGGRQSRAVAVRAGGRGDVTGSHRVWVAQVGANVSSPVVHDGHLYWVSDRNRTAYCLRLSDGGVVYAERVPGLPYASALCADGKIYVVTRKDGTLVLAAKPEFELLAHNRFSDRSTFDGSPAVSGNRMFLRSDTYLYCIGTDG